MRLFGKPIPQPIRKQVTPFDFGRAQKVLREIGIEPNPSQEIVIYPSKSAYARMRYERKALDGEMGFADHILRLAVKFVPAGLVDIKDNCAIHILPGNETIFFHEAVHAHDFAKRPDLVARLDTKDSELKDDRLALHAFLEGRAKFVERMGSKSREFTFIQRIGLKASNSLEFFVAGSFLYLGLDAARSMVETFAYSSVGVYHTLRATAFDTVLNSAVVLVCGLMIKTLSPYIRGIRFMDIVYSCFGKDAHRTLETTLKLEPTYDEIRHPKKYIERISSQGQGS